MVNEFVAGSGNIFADLGINNPELELAKAELAHAIRSIIRERKLRHSVEAHRTIGDLLRIVDDGR